MEFFLDTADVDEIREIAAWGVLDGVTTNPTLIARSGRDFRTVVAEIAAICSGPISAEVTATEFAGMIEQAQNLKDDLPENVIIKLPCTPDGLRATRWCSDNGIDTNVTLVFSTTQATLAAKAGATYVSPFVGRIDDQGMNGMELIRSIMEVWNHYGYTTKVLVASVRTTSHVLEALELGAHTATIPAKVFRQLMEHELTDDGIRRFLDDWKSVLESGNA